MSRNTSCLSRGYAPQCHDDGVNAIRTRYEEVVKACTNFRNSIYPNPSIDEQFGTGTLGLSTFLEMTIDQSQAMMFCRQNYLAMLHYQRRMVIIAFFTALLPDGPFEQALGMWTLNDHAARLDQPEESMDESD